jgi:uncharacterized protein YcfJ
MKTRILSIAASLLILSSATYADNYKHSDNYNYSDNSEHANRQTRHKYAKVIDVQPIYQNVSYYEPQQECRYEQRATRSNNNTTAVIVGSLLGGAIGNELGHKKSNKRVGAVAEAILGGSIANDVTRGNRSYYGQQEQVCTTTQQVRYEEKITGYNVAYRYLGETYYTRMDRRPNDKIKIEVSVRPVL